MNHPTKPHADQMPDLRAPERDETPLSQTEALIGLRDGVFGPGPYARSAAFATVTVVSRRMVEIFNFSEAR